MNRYTVSLCGDSRKKYIRATSFETTTLGVTFFDCSQRPVAFYRDVYSVEVEIEVEGSSAR